MFSLDPPTYEQACSGTGDIQGKAFAPFYPVYRKEPPKDDENNLKS